MKQAVNYDEKAKHIGLIIGIPQEIYYWRVSYTSTLYIERIDNEWCAWRETHLPDETQCKSHKTIVRGNFALVINRIKKYMKFVKQNR